MASYRFNAKIVSRSSGRNVVAAAAYRAGEKLVDERTGATYDLTNKQDVVHKAILLPENAPEWMADRSKLWNAVELNEKRKDAQLAREAQLTLPRELTIEQNIVLVHEFVQAEFVSRGMVADVCIHNPKASDGLAQPHAHVLLSFRTVNESGFGLKNRHWNDKTLLKHWREEWGNLENKHLALHGFDVRVDHRSYKDQGIDLEPQHKIGPVDARERMVRVADHQRIARENGHLIFENPTIAFDAMTRQQSTFSLQDLARFINRHSEHAEQFSVVFERVKSSPELVCLGSDDKGVERFSTRTMLELESSMMQHADALHHRLGHSVNEQAVECAKSTRTLSQEQDSALSYLTAPGDLKSIVGYAGTGKSYLLGAARDAWEQSGYRVQGAALAGIAALNLKDSSGIESRTIASLIYRLDQGMMQLTTRDVLVVDEAGMLGSRTVERLTREVEQAGAKLVLVGDWQQLQAIESGAAFRAIAENYQYGELSDIRRQTTPWQVQASLDLALGHVDKALHAYDSHDHVHRFASNHDAKEALISQWNEVRIASPADSQIILAYTRKDVQALNELARVMKRHDGELGEDVVFSMERGERAFAANDRVYFLKREDSLSVINGSLGTIRAIDAKAGLITVALDQDGFTKKSHLVQVNAHHYKHLEHGYAATVYKAQGVTVDRTYVLPTTHYDAHSTYVAMTRHRQSCDVFVSRQDFAHDNALVYYLNRNRAKDITLDYTEMNGEFGRQRGLKMPALHVGPNASIASNPAKPLTPSEAIQQYTQQQLAKKAQFDAIQQRFRDRLPSQVQQGKDGVQAFMQQQAAKKEELAAMIQTIRDKNNPHAQKTKDYLETLVRQKVSVFAQAFEQHQGSASNTSLSKQQEASVACLLGQGLHPSELLNALERDYPHIALQVKPLIQPQTLQKNEPIQSIEERER